MSQGILDSLYTRKSVRAYLDKEIGAQEKQAILRAAASAPTAGNQMLYTILDITDAGIKQQLSELCDHQPFIARAPLVLIFLADGRRWMDAYRMAGLAPRSPGPGDLLLSVADAVIAAQNAVVAAQAMGIGSCYIGDVLENAEAVRSLLHLPAQAAPAAMLCFGYPTQQQQQRKKPARFRLSHIVYENQYRELPREEIGAMFREREGEGEGWDLQAYLRAFCQRKYESGFAREMNRSAGVYLRDFMQQDEDGGAAHGKGR